MNPKNIRMCAICHERKPKTELLRLIKNNNDIVIDYSYKVNCKGHYICKNMDCIQKCISKKMLGKIFKQNIVEQNYNVLKEINFE